MAGEKTEVTISLRTIGPARPTTLRVHSPIQVRDLRRSVAAQGGHPLAQLKLVFRGRTLEDGDDRLLRLHDGDTLVVAVVPKAPAKHLHEGHDDDDDDDLKYHISESETWWKRKLFYFLQKRLKLPDILLMAIFSISLKTWSKIILWFSLLPVAHKFSLGPLYILATGFSVMFLNLGRRQPGDASAYSIFNEDFRELPGTLNADRIDRDIRAGQF